MADKQFTLLELHLGGGRIQIGPATLGGGEESEADSADAESDPDADGEGSCPARTAGKLLLAVLLVVAAAVVARKLLGGDEELAELEDLADLDEE